jgi:hypothetical protein
MGTGVEYLAAEELIGAELGAEILGGAELFGGAEALGGSAVLGDFAGTSLAGDIGGSLGLGGFGGGYGGLGAFEGLGGIGGFGVGLGDYGLGSLASSFGGYADGLGGVGITDATGVQNLSNVMGPTGGLNNPLGYGNALSSPSGIYATQPGQLLNSIQGVQGYQGVGANLITPTHDYLSSINPYTADPYAGTSLSLSPDLNQPLIGADQLTYDPATGQQLGRSATDLERSLVTGSGDVGSGRSTKELLSTYGRQPGTAPGFLDNLKTIGSFDSGVDLDTRLEALSNVGSKAFNTVFLNKNGDLNMPAAFAALSLYPTYAAAKAKASEIGVPFSELDYQAGKIAPSRQKYAAMAPKSAFGITTAANGGRIKFGTGGMSDNRISQLIQLLRDADAKGDQDMVDQIKLDLYRETRKATGGRVGYGDGKLVLEEGPANKATRLQMEKAAKEAQKRYADMKAKEKLMDRNYNEQSMYDFKKIQKELFDAAPEEGYPSLPEPTAPMQEEGVLSIRLTPTQKKAKGGRAGYADGAGPIPLGLVDYRGTPWENSFKAVTQPIERKIGLFSNPDGSYPGENMPNPIQALPRPGQYDTSGDGMESLIKQIIKQPYVPTNRPVNDLYQYYLNQENDEDKRKQIMGRVNPLFGIKKAHGGMMNHPIRRLEGGISELDLRAKGGFIPIGVKEKADDVPAMLSKNEFVFTADAVRNAGGGSINKGAQKMYKLMKSLENKKVNRKAN